MSVAQRPAAFSMTVEKRFQRGTHRACSPAQTVARALAVAPTAGITRLANITGLDRIGVPVVAVVRPNARSISVAQGKGLDLGGQEVQDALSDRAMSES